MVNVLITHTTLIRKYSPSSKQDLHNELMRAWSVGAISLYSACSPKHHGRSPPCLRSQLLVQELMMMSYKMKQHT